MAHIFVAESQGLPNPQTGFVDQADQQLITKVVAGLDELVDLRRLECSWQ